MDQVPTTNATKGEPESLKNRALETGAGMIQDFGPPKRLCAHLNAFHTYAAQPGRHVEAHHYCAHLNDSVRQCILYDSDSPNARLIGIEYMITAKLYEALPAEERRYWHSHVFEVKSGMLVMPKPAGSLVPDAVWEAAENKEMEEVIVLYGKVYHLWQTDRGDELPLGEPQLMMSFTQADQFDFDRVVGERDRRLGVESARKKEKREYIPVPEIHPDVDSCWKKS